MKPSEHDAGLTWVFRREGLRISLAKTWSTLACLRLRRVRAVDRVGQVLVFSTGARAVMYFHLCVYRENAILSAIYDHAQEPHWIIERRGPNAPTPAHFLKPGRLRYARMLDSQLQKIGPLEIASGDLARPLKALGQFTTKELEWSIQNMAWGGDMGEIGLNPWRRAPRIWEEGVQIGGGSRRHQYATYNEPFAWKGKWRTLYPLP